MVEDTLVNVIVDTFETNIELSNEAGPSERQQISGIIIIMCTYLSGMLILAFLNRDEIGEFTERMCNYGHE